MKSHPSPERPPAAGSELRPPRGGRYVRATIATKRPRHPRLPLYVLAVAVLLAAGALGWVKGAADRDGEAHTMLLTALGHVDAADDDIALVSTAVETTLTPQLDVAPSRRAGSAAKRARTRLRLALDLVGDARRKAKGEDRELASALRQAAEGRLAMLDAADDLLPLRTRAAAALAHTEAGWGSMTRAVKLADQATAQYNLHTRDGVGRSTTLMRQAESELASASAAFASATKALPEADLGGLKAYVEARRQIAAASITVDDVWLRGDVDAANRMLADLTAEQAGGLAGKARALPRTSGAPVRAAYERLAREGLKAYGSARKKAAAGDARLDELADPQFAQSSE